MIAKVTVTSAAVAKTKFLLACAIARLIVMLARVIFRSRRGFASVWTTARLIARVSGHGIWHVRLHG